MISDITHQKESWKIKRAYNNPNVTDSLELLLVDRKMVTEGSMRLISHFGVISNTGKHRPTNHAYKINFFYSTVVKECENMQLPSYGFEFQPFDSIRQNEVNDVYLI
ncbi:Replication factor A protein 1, partial [Bienertia sinuspersici]